MKKKLLVIENDELIYKEDDKENYEITKFEWYMIGFCSGIGFAWSLIYFVQHFL